jgi:ferric-dicitrate binding protein FerR (iron transport regulator)
MRKKEYQQLQYVASLITKYLEEKLSPEEKWQLEEWLEKHEENRTLFQSLTNEKEIQQSVNELLNIDRAAGLDRLMRQIKPRHISSIRTWQYAAAAAVLLFAGVTTMYYGVKHNRRVLSDNSTNVRYKNDIAPGGNKATLTLGNGSHIPLDTPADSSFLADNSTPVIKKEGTLTYNKNKTNTYDVVYNTLTTPYGGTYKLVLSDGTEAWLNAGSSLRFPTHFTGKERRVFLSGEGYFSIAKNAEQPFIVATARMEVLALGTAFNVMDYKQEQQSSTTLAEGMVKVTAGKQNCILKPGTAAIAAATTIQVVPADVTVATAWKNGLFIFDHADISTVMQQISRWYDVTVSYGARGIPPVHFTGEIKRQSTLAEVLQMLEVTGGVKFTIAHKQVIIN